MTRSQAEETPEKSIPKGYILNTSYLKEGKKTLQYYNPTERDCKKAYIEVEA